VNFRVGALGFVHLGGVWGQPYTAGNVGLLDVCAALEWVQDNIASFGGDPKNVTVFGLSSGAFMIAALFGAPAASGLFHRAWMQSGSASRVIERDVAAAQAAEFLETLGIGIGDSDVLATAVAVQRILDAQDRIVSRDLGERNAPRGRTLGVVDDGVTLAQHPFDVLRSGGGKGIPIVLGTTRDEARLWFAMGLMRETTEDLLEHEMARFAGSERVPGLLQAYRRLLPEADLARIRERFLTDAIYRVPAIRTATAHAAAGGVAYVYQFAWQSPVAPELGAFHGLDQSFVWGICDPQKLGLLSGTVEEQRLAAEMCAALGRFAHDGTPGWASYSAKSTKSRVFDGTDCVVDDVDSVIAAAWEGIERR
jgi:para-nitrobenzyl esterase